MANLSGEIHRLKRAGYGFAELGINGCEVLIRLSLLIFYTDVVGLRADYAGYAIALASLWDAVSDPLMGKLSDSFSIRKERRRPYIFIGSICLSLSIIAVFNPPSFTSNFFYQYFAGVSQNSLKFCYLVASYLFLNTSMTIISIPHAAFAADLSSDEKIRGELFGWRLFFANLGLVLGSALPGLLLLSPAIKTQEAEAFTALVLAMVVILSSLICLFATRGLDKHETLRGGMNIRSYLLDVKAILSQRNFFILLSSYSIANIGLSLNSSLALYFYQYRLALDKNDTNIVIALFMLVFCLTIGPWVLLARKYEKKSLIQIGLGGLSLITCLAYPALPPGDLKGPLLVGLLGGLCVGSVVLLDLAVAESADAHPGGDSYGAYFGIWKMAAKMSRACALALTGKLMMWIEFKPNVVQTAETSDRLAMAFGPFVASFLMLSTLILIAYQTKGSFAKKHSIS